MTTLPELSNYTGAVVVIYQPTTDVLENLRILSSQVDQLVIVDNGSNQGFQLLLQPFLNNRVKLIQHPENLGIATGFNTGLRRLIDSGCDFVFTFDQDSRIPSLFVQNMLASFLKAELYFGLIGVLMPSWRHPESINLPSKDGGLREVSQGISSGSLYPIKVFQKLGFFADEYFIDGVDIEFCLRCQTQNWKVIQDTSLTIEHSLGNEVKINLLGFQIPIIVHSPFRKYFIARNRILNYRKYALHNREWFFADFWIFIRELFHVFAYENEKLKKLWYTFIGIKDAMLNRTGGINPTLK
jgi:rhamnosyltransferase